MRRKVLWPGLSALFFIVCFLMMNLSAYAETPVDQGDLSEITRSKIGTIIQIDDSNQYVDEWKESSLAVNGTEAFCVDPLTNVDPGPVARQSLEGYGMSEDNITACGLIIHYIDHYLTEYDAETCYLLKQILIWRQINAQYGFNCGNIRVGEDVIDPNLQDQIIASCNQFVRDNLSRYTGSGYAFINGGQTIAQFSVRCVMGKASVRKTAVLTAITEGNPLYSLEGAQFGLYTDEACTDLLMTFTTDSEGNTETREVREGSYYFCEISASGGYKINHEVYPIEVSADETVTVEVPEIPILYTPDLKLEKIDAETGSSRATGAASLEGAEFILRYYAGLYDREELPDEALKTWVFKATADEETSRYILRFDQEHFVSGDDFYETDGMIRLPLGTLSIEESKAPDKYLLDRARVFVFDPNVQSPETGDALGKLITDADSMEIVQIVQQDEEAIASDQYFMAANRVLRGDLTFTKLDAATQKTMSGISFRITSDTTGESHVITTDSNGDFSSSSEKISHLKNTNGGGSDDGVWFGSQEILEPDDSMGAFPYDHYTIVELKGPKNKNKIMYEGTFVVDEQNKCIDLGSIENKDQPITEKSEKKVRTGDSNKLDFYCSIFGCALGVLIITAGTLLLIRSRRIREQK